MAENKTLKARVDYLSKQAAEVDAMREHEHLKILRDTQHFKDKCDQALLQLKYNYREMEELTSLKSYCDEIQAREAERV